MKITLIAICLVGSASFLMISCKKDNDNDNYFKAQINGREWKTADITVLTSSGGPEPQPVRVMGSLGNEIIGIHVITPATGSYPFRLANPNDINPAILVSIDVQNLYPVHRVKWTTSDETNLSHFAIEQSPDRYNWTSVADKPAAGPGDYYADITVGKSLALTCYYRIKTVDNDGRVKLSDAVLASSSPIGYYKPSGEEIHPGFQGNLEIISIDKTKRIIKGRIRFKATSASGQVYDITNGEFRSSY